MNGAVLSELVPPPPEGRVFEQLCRAGFADCAPSGRMRLDAVARWLQDIAYADVLDAELDQQAAWVVRRTRIRVRRFPRVGETWRVGTFCSGFGRMWAERRTSFTALDRDEGDVEAVTLWVHLDRTTGRPIPFSSSEAAIYGASAGGRRVTARLHHPAPGGEESQTRWSFRATELDIAGHINNAAYWEPLEEELLAGSEPERVDAELEYRAPSQPGEKVVLRNGSRRWIVGAEREIHASILVAELLGLHQF